MGPAMASQSSAPLLALADLHLAQRSYDSLGTKGFRMGQLPRAPRLGDLPRDPAKPISGSRLAPTLANSVAARRLY